MRTDGDSDIEGHAVGEQPQQRKGNGISTDRDPVPQKSRIQTERGGWSSMPATGEWVHG